MIARLILKIKITPALLQLNVHQMLTICLPNMTFIPLHKIMDTECWALNMEETSYKMISSVFSEQIKVAL